MKYNNTRLSIMCKLRMKPKPREDDNVGIRREDHHSSSEPSSDCAGLATGRLLRPFVTSLRRLRGGESVSAATSLRTRLR